MTTPVSTPPPRRSFTGNGVRWSSRTATGTALALLAAVFVTGPGCLLAVYLTPQDIRTPVAWTAGVTAVLLTAAVATAAFAFLSNRNLRAVIAVKEAEMAAERADNARLADELLPTVVERLRDGASANTALAAVETPHDASRRRILGIFATEVHRGEGMRAAAMAACANAAGRVQALATGMAADLREMEHKYSGEDVLGDLMHLDHRTAQAGRMADSIALLTGARSGRRWAKPIVMESILRGAMGRIGGYQRVRLHSTSEVAVAGHAAEGVMHALAELMDNAANFSPPTSEVHVYVEEVATGVVITIEDGGLVMGEVALRRAQQAVSAESFDLSTLSGTRLGLPVVGRLARKHGLSVSFRPSAHGGTGVLMMIPQALVTHTKRESGGSVPNSRPQRSEPLGGTAPANDRVAAAPSPTTAKRTTPVAGRRADAEQESGLPRRRPARQAEAQSAPAAPVTPTAPETPAAPAAPAAEYGESGLPKRPRGRTLAAAHQRAKATRPEPEPEKRRSAQQSGSRFGAFRKAVQGGTGTGPAAPAADSTPPETTARPAASRTDSDSEHQQQAVHRPHPAPFSSAAPFSSRPEDEPE